jgi:hypothetical protein
MEHEEDADARRGQPGEERIVQGTVVFHRHSPGKLHPSMVTATAVTEERRL